MKIILYSINYAPELVGIGKYNSEMAEWLADKGHDVNIITAPPYYPAWKIDAGYSRYWYSNQKINLVNVTRCPIWVPSQPSGAKRILHLFSFAVTSLPIIFWQALFHRPDIIFVVEPPIACTPGALIAGWLAGAKKWLHIQDFEIDAAFDLGILKSKLLRSWITCIETFIMRRFDVVSTISLKMLERLENKGVDEAKTILFENWVETDKIYPLSSIPPLYAELNLPKDRLIILYSGNMGEKQGLNIIIEAAKRFRDREDIYFLMCGTGSSRHKLEHDAQGIDNIGFIPLQPLEALNDLLNIAHIHLLPQQAGVEDLVMPSKLTNMMASGRPVIATVKTQSQVARVLDGCGIVVTPGDLDAFCQAINMLVFDPEKAREMGRNGRQYVESHWDIDNILNTAFD